MGKRKEKETDFSLPSDLVFALLRGGFFNLLESVLQGVDYAGLMFDMLNKSPHGRVRNHRTGFQMEERTGRFI